EVDCLRRHGLDIRKTKDIGPYKKIIPALESFPHAAIITADDDLIYWQTWLEELVAGWSKSNKEIVLHRAPYITLDRTGHPRPYLDWISEVPRQHGSWLLFPTGSAGVLYPPGSLSKKSLDSGTFTRICPRNDDTWLFWMARLANSSVLNLGTIGK